MGSGRESPEEPAMTGHTIVVHESFDATPEQVWRVITDVGGLADVLRSVTYAELLTDGPYDVGTRWTESRTFFGHHGTEELEVVETRPPFHTTHLTKLHGDVIRTSYSMTPHNNGTTRLSITATADMSGRGPGGKLGWIFFGEIPFDRTRRMLEHDLADIGAEVQRRVGSAS